MYVFPLRHPGTWLRGLDSDLAHSTQSLLDVLERHLADAAVGLAMFEEARARPWTMPDRDDARYARRRAIEESLEATLSPELSPEERWQRQGDIRDEAEFALKREEWAAGRVPDAYVSRLDFVHAHTVLYALDGVSKGLAALAGTPGLPAPVAAASAAFDDALPSLVEIRNSAHHAEDRARRRNKRGGPIDLKPVSNSTIEAPGGGVLILSSLNNNRLGYTLSSGHYEEVEISANSVAAAQTTIQQAFDGFTWEGPPRTVPD